MPNKEYARTVGVSVDYRRSNHCEESLAINTERLKTYLSKLVVFPSKPGKKEKGIASSEDCKAAVQDKTVCVWFRSYDCYISMPDKCYSGVHRQGGLVHT